MLNEPNVLTRLHELPYTFFLTGSRFFQNGRPDSDWDYFVQDTDGLTKCLKEMGFEECRIYNDPLSHFTLAHPEGIHVQIVSDITIKLLAQKIIQANNMLFGINKPFDRIVWRSVIQTIQFMDQEMDQR